SRRADRLRKGASKLGWAIHNFFLSREPIFTAGALSSVSGGKTAEIIQLPRAVFSKSRRGVFHPERNTRDEKADSVDHDAGVVAERFFERRIHPTLFRARAGG